MPYYIECYNCIYFKKLPMFFSKGKCDNPASEKYQKEMHETENCDKFEFLCIDCVCGSKEECE